MSKFDYAYFHGGYDDFAVSKEKYTKKQAIDIFKSENEHLKGKGLFVAVCNAFVRHRAGVNEDYEPCVGWWLEYKQHKRSCPVWAFHTTKDIERDKKKFKGYDYYEF